MEVPKSFREYFAGVQDGSIGFPYRRLFCESAKVMIQNLKKVPLDRRTVINRGEDKLSGYNYGILNGRTLTYNDVDTRLGSSSDGEKYGKSVNWLSDLYGEEQRLQARRSDQEMSTMDAWWNKDFQKKVYATIIEDGDATMPTPERYRDIVYLHNAEAKAFNPVWGKRIVDFLFPNGTSNGKSMLDISAGWGDRLLVAIACGMKYTGFDPNERMRKVYDKIIEELGDPTQHKVTIAMFEEAPMPKQLYDLVLTSPPFFETEVYNEESSTQSLNMYPDAQQWKELFLLYSILKAWTKLKVGGYIALYIADTRTMSVVDDILTVMRGTESKYLGVVGVVGDAGKSRPVWIWRKTGEEVAISWERYPSLYTRANCGVAINREYLTILSSMAANAINNSEAQIITDGLDRYFFLADEEVDQEKRDIATSFIERSGLAIDPLYAYIVVSNSGSIDEALSAPWLSE